MVQSAKHCYAMAMTVPTPAFNSDFGAFRDPRTGAPLMHRGDRLIAPDGTAYPILDGIAHFTPDQSYADDFGAQWNSFRTTQLDSVSGLPVSRNRLTRCLGGDLETLAGQQVLEAGSGAGRFTEVLLDAGAQVHSFDLSSAVTANAANNGHNPHLRLARADIRQIPFARGAYDLVLCLGVLQHTPSPEDSIAALWQMVRPGGRLVIDHYRFRWRFALPTPFGDAGGLYRRIILRLPPHRRAAAVRRVTEFWFPWHWRWRDSIIMQRIIRRFSPVRFYYPDLPLRDRDMHYQWSLLDTHDSTTDYYKHLRSPHAIESTLRALGAQDVQVWIGGNGVEASCRKPA